MLEMRPDCECCGAGLPADQPGAWLCSFECTFCAACATARLRGVCPNCGGPLAARPPRPAELLGRFPGSTARKARPAPCPTSDSD